MMSRSPLVLECCDSGPFYLDNVSIMKNTRVIVPVGLCSEYQTPFRKSRRLPLSAFSAPRLLRVGFPLRGLNQPPRTLCRGAWREAAPRDAGRRAALRRTGFLPRSAVSRSKCWEAGTVRKAKSIASTANG